MELKDVILSTLAEMEDPKVNNDSKPINNLHVKPAKDPKKAENIELEDEITQDDEMLFLTSMRERLLVLFEGFQAPNNTNIEAKIDMTLNFLEYVLVTIDSRVEKLKKGNK